MIHDPLCAVVSIKCIHDEHVLVGRFDQCERCDITCECELIAQVRADERKRAGAR